MWTTSLHYYLGQHPQIVMSKLKETNYFSGKDIQRQNLYYDAEIIDDHETYLEQFEISKNGSLRYRGEASVSYLFYPDVALRIHEYNLEARIIIMLRDPVKRAVSHYQMDKRLGYTNKTLKEVIGKQKEFSLYYQQFIEVGEYHDQIKRYLDLFGTEKVKIIELREMKNDPQKALDDICQFLNIESFFPNDLEKKNTYRKPVAPGIKQLYSSPKIREIFSAVIPSSLKEALKNIVLKKVDKDPVSPEVYEWLNHHYRKDVVKLEKLLGKEFNHWLSNGK